MKNLLLLEEDTEGRDLFARILMRKGFNVIQAPDEACALAEMSSGQRRIDIVLAGATYKDRLEFLADLRDKRPRVPVIFLADCPEPESRLRCIMGPFAVSKRHNFYINTRPVAFQELDRLLRIIAGRSGGSLHGRYREKAVAA